MEGGRREGDRDKEGKDQQKYHMRQRFTMIQGHSTQELEKARMSQYDTGGDSNELDGGAATGSEETAVATMMPSAGLQVRQTVCACRDFRDRICSTGRDVMV
jgi:hypothetical protein